MLVKYCGDHTTIFGMEIRTFDILDVSIKEWQELDEFTRKYFFKCDYKGLPVGHVPDNRPYYVVQC